MINFIFAIHPPPSGPVCDFCSDPKVVAALPCEDFAFQKNPAEHSSIGAWAACETCDKLIREEKWEELLNRSLEQYRKTFGFVPLDLKKHIRDLHRLFRKHRRQVS